MSLTSETVTASHPSNNSISENGEKINSFDKKEDPANFILRLKSLEKAVLTYDLAEFSNDIILENSGKINTFFKMRQVTAPCLPYVVQAVPDTKARTLYVVSAFIGESGYKKEAPQLINAKGPDATANTGSASASNSSISENSEKINTFDKKIDDERKSISKSVDSEGNSLSAVRQGTVGCL